jgi:hypothetical protein
MSLGSPFVCRHHFRDQVFPLSQRLLAERGEHKEDKKDKDEGVGAKDGPLNALIGPTLAFRSALRICPHPLSIDLSRSPVHKHVIKPSPPSPQSAHIVLQGRVPNLAMAASRMPFFKKPG